MVLVGPGGVGKGTVIRRLVALDDRLWLSRSWTTRARRPGEPESAYEFVSEAQFTAHRDAGGFLEWAEILDHLYGTPEPHPPAGSDVVLEIDVQGALQVRDKRPDALVVLLTAPSVADQVARLEGRGDSEDQIDRRVRLGFEEVAAARRFADREIVNDDLDMTVALLAAIIEEARKERSGGARPG